MRTLQDPQNEAHGVALGGFLMLFLDATVTNQAMHVWEVVGTEHSTFSTFVPDMVWRRFHGYGMLRRD